jgi:hypothetical protein
MVKATVQISESNTSSETVTDGISNVNMGAGAGSDIPNLTSATYPVSPGSRSREKWLRAKLVAKNDSQKVKNFRVWRSGTDPSPSAFYKNDDTGYTAPTFDSVNGPQELSDVCTQALPGSDPAAAKIGIGGSLTGELSTNGTYTDYFVLQVLLDGSETAAKTSQITVGWLDVQ